MVPDHGAARVGTMQVQAIMPPLTSVHLARAHRVCMRWKNSQDGKGWGHPQGGFDKKSRENTLILSDPTEISFKYPPPLSRDR